jgi:hypothetical protein
VRLALRRLEISIDAASAVFPITVDPVLTTPGWTAEGNQAHSHFGLSVGSAGDVNGDGFSDVIIGAPVYANDLDNEGTVFVYYGSASGLSGDPWTAGG